MKKNYESPVITAIQFELAEGVCQSASGGSSISTGGGENPAFAV